MSTKRFGDVLAERRRRLGLTIDQAVSATKLRPQAIDAFERSDFSALPPKGYAQGMLSSYARFLRLDPKEVLSAYFDELYLYEREKQLAARSERSFRYGSPEDVVRRRTGGQYGSSYAKDEDDTHVVYTRSARRQTSTDRTGSNSSYNRYTSQSRNVGPVGQVRSSRSYGQSEGGYAPAFDERDNYGRTGVSALRSSERRRRRGARLSGQEQTRASRYSRLEPAYESYEDYDRQASRSKTRSHTSSQSSYPAFSAIATLADNFGVPRVYAYLGVGALTLILLFILVFSVKSCVSSKVTQSAPVEKPVVALPAQNMATQAAQTSQTSSQTQNSLQTQEPAKKDVLTISIAEGKSSYMDIELDGKIVAHQTFKGPLRESYTINSSIKVTATAASNVELKLNGTKVRFKNSGSTGIFNYIVNEGKE